MLAVHNDAGDIGDGHASVKEEKTRLWLAGGTSKNGNIVSAVVSDLSWERECGVVASDEYVVTAVIHQLHGIARSVHQSYELAANAEGRLRTNDLNSVDVTRYRSGAIGDGADLPRVGRLRKNRHREGGSVRERGRKSKISVSRSRGGNRKIVPAVVLQDQPGSHQSRNRAANRGGISAGDLNVRDVGQGSAVATAYTAVLRGS